MMTPYLLARNMFDELADAASATRSTSGLMCTDIRETTQGYELAMDLPGVKKENISIELKNGYLCVGAMMERDTAQDGTQGKYLRRERFSGTARRSFYVGNKVTQQDIHARFADGTLYLNIPKQEYLVSQARHKIHIE